MYLLINTNYDYNHILSIMTFNISEGQAVEGGDHRL